MSDVSLTVVIKDYDHVAPLAAGDVEVEGIDLELDRDTENALDRTLRDEEIEVGELSFMRHIIRLANDDRSFVGFPVFPTQRFRERCFYTRRDTGIDALADLAGKRIGTNEWPATGNTWSRAALRERGVEIDSIDWWVGPVDDPDYPMRPQGELPSNVQMAASGRTLREMLLADELDGLMCPLPPEGFYDETDPVVRVRPDYRQAEIEFYKRTNIYPPHHLMGIRREVYEENPWIAERLCDAFEAAKDQWLASRRRLTDTTPWLMPEIEETVSLIGEDWLPYGIDAKQYEIERLCREAYEQGLIDEPLDPESVFAEYKELTGTAGN